MVGNERITIGEEEQNKIEEMLEADLVHLSIVAEAAVEVHRKTG